MNEEYNTAVYAKPNGGEEVQIGWAADPDQWGSRAVHVFPEFDGVPLEDLRFDDAPEEPVEEPVDEEPDNGVEFSVPLTRAEAKEQDL